MNKVMSELHSEYERHNRRTNFSGSISDIDVFGSRMGQHGLEDLIERVTAEISQRVVDSIMTELEPRMRAALKIAFSEFVSDTPESDKA